MTTTSKVVDEILSGGGEVREPSSASIRAATPARQVPTAKPRLTDEEIVRHLTAHAVNVSFTAAGKTASGGMGCALSGAGVHVEAEDSNRRDVLQAATAAHRAAVESLAASRRGR